MPQFHETGYGSRFYNGQLPALIKALEKIASSFEEMTKVFAAAEGKFPALIKALEKIEEIAKPFDLEVTCCTKQPSK